MFLTLTCLVIAVHDGDTLRAQCGQQTYSVRLAGIDAPELKQPYSLIARDHLKQLTINQSVELQCHKKDKYQRQVCKVVQHGVDINLKQIQHGWAWYYLRYRKEQNLSDQQTYAEAEAHARANQLGLWQEANPTPPWRWRQKTNTK